MKGTTKRTMSWIDLTILAGSCLVAVFLVQQNTSTVRVAASAPEVTPHIVPARTPAKVVWVTDGDTLDVLIDGKRESVRLIGIDAPEVAHKDTPAQCLGQEASLALRSLAYGKTVLLESDPSQSDRDIYNRLLRYVYLSDGTSLNLMQLADGYSKEYTFGGVAYAYQRIYREKQNEAHSDSLGVWKTGVCSAQK